MADTPAKPSQANPNDTGMPMMLPPPAQILSEPNSVTVYSPVMGIDNGKNVVIPSVQPAQGERATSDVVEITGGKATIHKGTATSDKDHPNGIQLQSIEINGQPVTYLKPATPAATNQETIQNPYSNLGQQLSNMAGTNLSSSPLSGLFSGSSSNLGSSPFEALKVMKSEPDLSEIKSATPLTDKLMQDLTKSLESVLKAQSGPSVAPDAASPKLEGGRKIGD